MGKKFLGKIYTGDNFDDFLPPLDVDPLECTKDEYRKALERQRWRAKKEIQREKKHLRAFLKGKESYKDGYTYTEVGGVKFKVPNIYQVQYKITEDET